MFIDEHARASVVDRYLIKVVCTAKFGNFENKLAKGTRLIVLAFNVALHDPCIGKVSPMIEGEVQGVLKNISSLTHLRK